LAVPASSNSFFFKKLEGPKPLQEIYLKEVERPVNKREDKLRNKERSEKEEKRQAITTDFESIINQKYEKI
jgi:hypothetical protein